MTVFEYIMGIHSIVLGLATASLLSTFAEQLKYREATGHYWVHSAWCVTLLFFILSGWWGYWYTFDKLENISIFTFLYTFQYSIAMYLCARLLSPDPVREPEGTSIEEYYFRVKTPFLIVFLYGILTWSLASPLGVLPSLPQGELTEAVVGWIVFNTLLLAAIFSSNRLLHGVVVTLILLMQIAGEAAQGAIGL